MFRDPTNKVSRSVELSVVRSPTEKNIDLFLLNAGIDIGSDLLYAQRSNDDTKEIAVGLSVLLKLVQMGYLLLTQDNVKLIFQYHYNVAFLQELLALIERSPINVTSDLIDERIKLINVFFEMMLHDQIVGSNIVKLIDNVFKEIKVTPARMSAFNLGLGELKEAQVPVKLYALALKLYLYFDRGECNDINRWVIALKSEQHDNTYETIYEGLMLSNNNHWRLVHCIAEAIKVKLNKTFYTIIYFIAAVETTDIRLMVGKISSLEKAGLSDKLFPCVIKVLEFNHPYWEEIINNILLLVKTKVSMDCHMAFVKLCFMENTLITQNTKILLDIHNMQIRNDLRECMFYYMGNKPKGCSTENYFEYAMNLYDWMKSLKLIKEYYNTLKLMFSSKHYWGIVDALKLLPEQLRNNTDVIKLVAGSHFPCARVAIITQMADEDLITPLNIAALKECDEGGTDLNVFNFFRPATNAKAIMASFEKPISPRTLGMAYSAPG